jgi:iron complex outermembrane receptor protein
MLLINKYIFRFFFQIVYKTLAMLMLLYLFNTSVYAQTGSECTFSLQGTILYEDSNLPVEGALVFVEELDRYVLTSADGKFKFEKICQRNYKLHIDMISCGHKDTIIHVPQTGICIILLQPTEKTSEIIIQGNQTSDPSILNSRTELSGQELERIRGATLGEALKTIPGVYALQTGPSIFKPVIHGMHSNRILILNNGVRQEGQQWGSEHAPEIDPFIATKLTIIKGPASIRYGSDAIAGVILVDPAEMPSAKGINGEVNLVGASNNRMGVSSGMMQGALDKKLSGLSWRVQGTYRRAGNAKTPDYYMENTGFQEVNYSTALAYTKTRFGGALYYSQFNTKLGIFTGSQAETVPDIIAAINRPEPITPSYFSYKIDRPYQQVKHDLFKANGYIRFSNTNRLDITFARQQNIRSEYDYLPLTGITTPELYLDLTSHSIDMVYKHAISNTIEGSVGFNGMTQGNIRMYQMLIPNFRNYSGGIFAIEKWTRNKWTVEAGMRYDYKWLRAYMVDNTTAQIITPTFNWQNATGSAGTRYVIKKNLFWVVNVSNAWRAPTVNELLSNGVHQSAVAYEIGNINLRTERSYNASTEINYQSKRLQADMELYNNYINGYIFLKPDLSYIHTARGAYPSYTYTQVNAVFRGADISVGYRVIDSLYFYTKTSLLFAYNKTIHDYLQLVPANRFENTLKYVFKNNGKFKQAYISVTSIYTAKQKRVPANSDYAAPPSGYMLINADIGCSVPMGNQQISISFSVQNIGNIRYRDYMDRFRYFTDEPGRNFTLRMKIPFTLLTQHA